MSSCDNLTQKLRGDVDVIQDHHLAEYFGYVIVVPLICSIGVILNIINFTIFTRKKFRTGVSYLMMSALAVVDGMTLFFSMPLGMSRCGHCKIDTALYFRLFFEIYFYIPITNFSENMSVMITIALCVERYISMQHYALSKIYCNRRNTYILLFVLILISAAMNMPYFFLYKIHCSRRVSLPLNDSPAFVVFSLVRAILVQFLPLIILILINGLLMYSVYQAELRREAMGQGSRESRRARAQIRLTILLISIVFLFLLGNIPVAFAYKGIYTLLYGIDAVGSSHFSILRTVTHILSLASYASNFILYCALNKHFLSALVSMFGVRRKSGGNSVTPVNKIEMTSTGPAGLSSGNDEDNSIMSEATIA